MKTRIGILGLGGVGGYFGGLLAKAYAGSDAVEVVFIARGKAMEVIAESGLKICTDEGETTVFPSVVSNVPEVIGKLDFLICATKTYDIEESLEAISKCITKNTVFLPLYNGVDATERISTMFPDNEVLQGCVYIVSMITSPGVIKKVGVYEKLFFGSDSASIYKMKALQTIFENAKIESYLVENIEDTVWEKFVFISSLASATSYLNQNIGEILESAAGRNLYVSLLNEITMIAAVKGLNLPNDIVMQTIVKLEKSPREATSSMHRDLLAGRKIELSSLTEFVVNEGLKYEIDTPTYQMVLDKLTEQESN
ncbi:2-dehydropantoate 2-reductase [Flavobacterium branchiarum]|uniref:2-dehydropantoate 2-reductase n=1 Tax=Flavobacterium branchiarum TaxID=1114870 RepID=A0ABV5FPS8_9FLAO|nr:2-dehydropantoate 2-reductase [Flavobacterium branchiarum]MDN3672744.1 2-dehydropantoate 2-reductase [Flavobacterium branchiarum]